jgi:hypothetical protein
MRTGPPSPAEIGHILSIRNAVEGREWSPEVEARLAMILRIFAASRQRKRTSDWAAQKYHREREARGGDCD